MLCDFGSMLRQGVESSTDAGEDAAAANGAPETSSSMAAIGDEEKGRGGEESGGGGSSGKRWPKQETVALIQIRSDMDAVFRDSSHKGPLWEEVSRKMAAMGYHRSAKKCKEKFENVYKYHKRTKDGRSTKSEGKNYRFFQQLEALEAANSSSSFLPPVDAAAVPIAMAMPRPSVPTPGLPPPSATQPQVISTAVSAPVIHHIPVPVPVVQNANPMNYFPSSTSGTPSSSWSTSSDEEVAISEKRSGGNKRKWQVFFEKLTRDVMQKQEELQRKFLEAIEKRENERRVRDEAWKAQEMARLKREHDILVQERSMAGAKDAALIAFLQKISDQKQIPLPAVITQPPPPPPRPSTPTTPTPPPVPVSHIQETRTPNPTPLPATTPQQMNNGGTPASSSRWPKAEIDALIKLRTSMDYKYHDSGPKGALWEEISMEMRKIGYFRNAKRCKEKWENINKYFRKVKESNKRRRYDAKTCPYYDQLEVLYTEKKHKLPAPPPPIMALPEQQWPLPPPPPEQDPVSDNMDQDDEDDEDDDDDLEGGYEIVANSSNGASMAAAS